MCRIPNTVGWGLCTEGGVAIGNTPFPAGSCFPAPIPAPSIIIHSATSPFLSTGSPPRSWYPPPQPPCCADDAAAEEEDCSMLRIVALTSSLILAFLLLSPRSSASTTPPPNAAERASWTHSLTTTPIATPRPRPSLPTTTRESSEPPREISRGRSRRFSLFRWKHLGMGHQDFPGHAQWIRGHCRVPGPIRGTGRPRRAERRVCGIASGANRACPGHGC